MAINHIMLCLSIQTNSSSNVLPDNGCTLNSIARICHILHAKTMVNDYQKDIFQTYDHLKPSVAEWRGQARCGAEIINAVRQ